METYFPIERPGGKKEKRITKITNSETYTSSVSVRLTNRILSILLKYFKSNLEFSGKKQEIILGLETMTDLVKWTSWKAFCQNKIQFCILYHLWMAFYCLNHIPHRTNNHLCIKGKKNVS